MGIHQGRNEIISEKAMCYFRESCIIRTSQAEFVSSEQAQLQSCISKCIRILDIR